MDNHVNFLEINGLCRTRYKDKSFSERWNCSLFWRICKDNADSKAATWAAAEAVPREMLGRHGAKQ